MIEQSGKFPYAVQDPKVLERKALVTLDAEQLVEIANVFYYVNKYLARVPKFLGGVDLSGKREIHKSIHDCVVNCVLSLEELERVSKVTGGKE